MRQAVRPEDVGSRMPRHQEMSAEVSSSDVSSGMGGRRRPKECMDTDLERKGPGQLGNAGGSIRNVRDMS